MIYLYELINPLYRDISIEDKGHPYFIIEADLTKNIDELTFEAEIVFQRLVGRFFTLNELIDGVSEWDEKMPYKTALINELTKEI